MNNRCCRRRWFCRGSVYKSSATCALQGKAIHLNLIQPVQTDGPNIFRHGKGVSPGVNDVERIQLEIVQRRTGRLMSNVTSAAASFVPRGATTPQTIRFDFGNGTAAGGSGLDGLTQYAATSAISFISAEPT